MKNSDKPDPTVLARLLYANEAAEIAARCVLLDARAALDMGHRPEDVASALLISKATLYRRLADAGLTYGRFGRLRR